MKIFILSLFLSLFSGLIPNSLVYAVFDDPPKSALTTNKNLADIWLTKYNMARKTEGIVTDLTTILVVDSKERAKSALAFIVLKSIIQSNQQLFLDQLKLTCEEGNQHFNDYMNQNF